MKVGDLVKWPLGKDVFWLAIVMADPIDDLGTPSTLVQWITGRYVGDTDYIYTEDLEVIG